MDNASVLLTCQLCKEFTTNSVGGLHLHHISKHTAEELSLALLASKQQQQQISRKISAREKVSSSFLNNPRVLYENSMVEDSNTPSTQQKIKQQAQVENPRADTVHSCSESESENKLAQTLTLLEKSHFGHNLDDVTVDTAPNNPGNLDEMLEDSCDEGKVQFEMDRKTILMNMREENFKLKANIKESSRTPINKKCENFDKEYDSSINSVNAIDKECCNVQPTFKNLRDSELKVENSLPINGQQVKQEFLKGLELTGPSNSASEKIQIVPDCNPSLANDSPQLYKALLRNRSAGLEITPINVMRNKSDTESHACSQNTLRHDSQGTTHLASTSCSNFILPNEDILGKSAIANMERLVEPLCVSTEVSHQKTPLKTPPASSTNETILGQRPLKHKLHHSESKKNTSNKKDVKHAIIKGNDSKTISEVPQKTFPIKIVRGADRRYSCSICNNSYKKKSHLDRHMKSHTGERPYECIVCNKRFSVKCVLQQHMRIHTGEKPYTCSVCGDSFKQTSGLMTHMMLHTGKPFKCDRCDKSFVSNHKLQMHSRVHADGITYKCELCNNAFFTLSAMEQHVRIVHSETKEHVCEICGQCFRLEVSLKVHLDYHIADLGGEEIIDQLTKNQTTEVGTSLNGVS